jgi:hypothetical protein
MKNELIELLQKELSAMKADYITKVESWNLKEFARIIVFLNDISKLSYSDLLKKYGKFYEIRGKKIDYIPQKFHDKVTEAKKKFNAGLDELIASEKLKAEKRFDISIAKIASIIETKKLDTSTLKIDLKQTIAGTFSATITDGNQTIFVRTIIAEGTIQRPHYRVITS